MEKLAIIDIGSNSIRMIVLEVRPDGSYKLTDDVKESVRLGDSLTCSDELSKDKMTSAIETLRFFMDLIRALSVAHVICVATEAVRRASNSAGFLKMARDMLGLEVRILTGTEEAWYDYIGTVNTMILPDCLIMDIGGSSTELIKVIDNHVVNSVSLPVGAITIAQMLTRETHSDHSLNNIHRLIKKQFGAYDWICGVHTLIGIGGSFRNLAKIDQKQRDYPLDLLHNYLMSAESVSLIYSKLTAMSSNERRNVKGLSKERADILPGALAEIYALLDTTGITDVVISGSGLREGLFFDFLLAEDQPIKDVFEFSVQNVMRNYNINQPHARHVWELANSLYLQLGESLVIDGSRHNILVAAAVLHDSGINISYYDHHKHSFYQILNSHLNGLTHKELVMAASIALLHRKNEMKIPQPYRAMLCDQEILTVQQLGLVLQLAESLDRRQNGNIYMLRCETDVACCRIFLSAKTDASLEIKDSQKATLKFLKLFKRKLVVELA